LQLQAVFFDGSGCPGVPSLYTLSSLSLYTMSTATCH